MRFRPRRKKLGTRGSATEPRAAAKRNRPRRLTLEKLEWRRVLATVTVDTISDVEDGDTSSISNLNNSPGDDGVISLREAILAANSTSGADTIEFNIGGTGPHTIQVGAGGLPEISDPVTIDGYSQSGASANTNGVDQGLNTSLQIELDGSQSNDAIGLDITAGSSTIRGLVINRFLNGILLRTSGSNVIAGNFIGTNTTGTAAAPNVSDGVVIEDVGSNTIGGLNPADRNLISGNNFDGVFIVGSGATDNVIQGNLIGTDINGTGNLGNSDDGVDLDGTTLGRPTANTIGGTASGARNIISGNLENGVTLEQADGNFIQGNYIGTDVTGTAALGNGGSTDDGLNLIDSANNTIGGTTAGAGNLISGNAEDGMELIGSGSTGNVIQGNLIGTDVTGSIALGNGEDGIDVDGGSGNTVGGTSQAARNVISGNADDGVDLQSSSTNNTISGNYIGTDIDGTQAIPNGSEGVEVTGSNNTIGGADPGAGNLISGNEDDGVELNGEGASNNTLAGNRIGTDASGTNPLMNGSDGIEVDEAVDNTIGGATAAAFNIIAFNDSDGIDVRDGAVRNRILGNSIFANEDLGINLDGGIQDREEVTLNDDLDADSGSNGLQNFPLLETAASGTDLTVDGSLFSTPDSTFDLQFYSNTNVDRSNHGEGELFLGTRQVTTDASGVANFSLTLNGVSVPAGRAISATATDAAGNTSEFSAVVFVNQGSVAGQVFDDGDASMVRDGAEVGLNGFRINVFNSMGHLVDATVSRSVDVNGDGSIDAQTESGLYAIQALNPGTYTIELAPQRGFQQTTPASSLMVTIAGGDAFVDQDFGIMSVELQGEISGLKCQDLNGNGVCDGTLVAGDAPDVVFVIDVSGSSENSFGGSPVGDLNGDGLSDTILDAEIAAFSALNQQLIDSGFGGTARVSIVAFDDVGTALDMDPNTAEFELTTSPGTDTNVVDVLTSLLSGSGTNYEAGLQEALATLNTLGTTGENGNVIFLSDGQPTAGESFDDEVRAGRLAGFNFRAFGVGPGAELPDLQRIDPDAVIFSNTDELLDVFSGSTGDIIFSDPPGVDVTIFIDGDNNGEFDASQDTGVQTDVDGNWSFTGLDAGTYIIREVVPEGFTQTAPAGGFFEITIGSGEIVDNIHFANEPPCSLIVNTTLDVVDPADSVNSLREAISCANQTPQADTISLSNGTYALTIQGSSEENNASGDLDVRAPLTLESVSGNAADVILDASTLGNNGSGDRILHVDRTRLDLRGLTLRGGNVDDTGGGILNAGTLNIHDSIITDNEATDGGGGIMSLNFGSQDVLEVTLFNTDVTGNRSVSGGGIANAAFGGQTTLTLNNSRVTGNTATADDGNPLTGGGGIATFAGYGGMAATNVFDSTVSGNTALFGGGIANFSKYRTSATLNVARSTISGNTATDSGGGIAARTGGFYVTTVTIEDSTISGNVAVEGSGGGIANAGDVFNIRNSTISGNTAAQSGGGIYNTSQYSDFGRLNISNSTIAGNTATSGEGGGIFDNDGSAFDNLHSTIIGDNTAGNGGADLRRDAAIGSATFNLIENAAGHVVADGVDSNRVGLDPVLGSLGDNGGPTETHLPLPGSPALDQGTNPTSLVNDQRGTGFARTVDDPAVDAADDGTDIGAVEAAPIPCSLVVTSTGDAVDAFDQQNTFREAILCANDTSGLDTITFDIPGMGPHRIQPMSALPEIIDPVVIDGYSQTGASANTATLADGLNTVLMIELNGDNAGSIAAALTFRQAAAGSTLRGLAVNGFSGHGVLLTNNSDTSIVGNFIGTDVTGVEPVANDGDGILAITSSGLQIGGDLSSDPGLANLLSGNTASGVHLRDGAQNNEVLGNVVGLNAAGDAAIANSEYGVAIYNGQSNRVGRPTSVPGTGPGNVISGNLESGVDIDSGVSFNQPSRDNFVQGNLIGLGSDGNLAVGNQEQGVVILDAAGNLIGGPNVEDGNVISSNAFEGVLVDTNVPLTEEGVMSSDNLIQNNWIGTAFDGTTERGNELSGIVVRNSNDNQILENTIRFNSLQIARTGVVVDGSVGVVISRNAISDNNGLGIDLVGGTEDSFGVTANDALDADDGSNNLQNAPVLTGAAPQATETRITGSLESLPNSVFRIEFFSSAAADPSGFGEGADFFGQTNVSTDSSGLASIEFVAGTSVALNQFITATATLLEGEADLPVETSEFSNAIEIQEVTADLELTKSVNNETPNVGEQVTFTVTLSNQGSDAATNIQVQDILPGGLDVNSITPSAGTFDNDTWTVTSLAGGASATLTIVATVTSPSEIVNTAEVIAADQADPDSTPGNSDGDEDDQDSVTLTPQVADLSLIKIIDNSSPQVGEQITLTTMLSNDGPAAATNVTVLDPLADGLAFVSATPSVGSYDETTGIWTVGTLNNNTTVSLQVVATLVADVSLTLTAQVATSDQFDPDSTPGNNVASEDDQSSTNIGACLTGGPFAVGINRLIYACASPGAIVAFLMGTEGGESFFPNPGIDVDVVDPDVPALGVADLNGVAVVLVELTADQLAEPIVFQAVEMAPNPHVSNTLILQEAPEAPLRVSSLGVGGSRIPTGDLPPIVEEAVARWEAAGLSAADAARLRSVDVRVGDLPHDLVGATLGDTILLDNDAAGHGWFIDASPHDDFEFTQAERELLAQAGSDAEGVDVLSVLMHEMGHLLGFHDRDGSGTEGHLMQSLIKPGERRLPNPHTNLTQSEDVNGDGQISPADVLMLINLLNQKERWSVDEQAQIEVAAGEFVSIYPDVDRDYHVVPRDVLRVIDYLNEQSEVAEGEAASDSGVDSAEADDAHDLSFADIGTEAESEPTIEQRLRPALVGLAESADPQQRPHSQEGDARHNTSMSETDESQSPIDALFEDIEKLLGAQI